MRKGRNAMKAMVMLLVLGVSFCLTGCAGKGFGAEQSGETEDALPQWEGEELMLLDCYRAGVDGEYHELVITTTDDPSKVRLDKYVKEDGEETQTTCYISGRTAQECLALVEEYGLSGWNDLEDGISLDGAKKVCKFWNGKEHIRVSTEHMPADGESKLDALFALVESFAHSGSEK